jgi:hypothetical protein
LDFALRIFEICRNLYKFAFKLIPTEATLSYISDTGMENMAKLWNEAGFIDQ